MVDEYLIWKRMQDDLAKQFETLSDQLYMNNKLKIFVLGQIKKLDRAGKVPKNAKKAEV